MPRIELPQDYSLVLQEVADHGEEEISMLAESLNLETNRLNHILIVLHHKGLVCFSKSAGHGMWVRLSSKGRKILTDLWPESGLSYGY